MKGKLLKFSAVGAVAAALCLVAPIAAHASSQNVYCGVNSSGITTRPAISSTVSTTNKGSGGQQHGYVDVATQSTVYGGGGSWQYTASQPGNHVNNSSTTHRGSANARVAVNGTGSEQAGTAYGCTSN